MFSVETATFLQKFFTLPILGFVLKLNEFEQYFIASVWLINSRNKVNNIGLINNIKITFDI